MDKQLTFNHPLVEQRADPYVYLHTDGYYYFTGSHPKYDRIELRRAKSLNELKDTPEINVIWTKHESGEMSEHIWAPELHYIDGVWYIYFAAGERDDAWKIRPFALSCTAENPLEGDWHEEGLIKLQDSCFSLDMTTFYHKGKRYFSWAQKMSEDEGSCIMLASASSPTMINDDAFILTKPEYEWEQRGFKVNEGPFALIRNGKVILTFSASDTSHNYCMGLIWADENADLLDPLSWHKPNRPVFETNESDSIYGPGHNSFTTVDGKDVLIYHAREYKGIKAHDPLYDPNRHAYAKFFEYDENGMPVFQ